MRTIRLSISAFVMSALLGLAPTAARATQPATVEEAQAAAKAARDRADHFESLGGVGYKTGLERTAQSEAARYEARAAELCQEAAAAQTPDPACPTTTSPPVNINIYP